MYKLSIQEVLSKLNVGQTGLNNNQVLKNRNQYGVNAIDKEKRKSL